MQSAISARQWHDLEVNGYVCVPGAFAGELAALDASVKGLLARYPNGFIVPPLYTGKQPTPREQMPKPTDRAPTVIIPNFGFIAPELMKPLANPFLYELIERVVGKGFCLNNTWFQMVPPGTGRLAYHKDARGSITLNILLDDIGPKMGSTCVVPGTHLNTPPPAFCMDNIQRGDPREVDMIGDAGDLVLFSNETWHARAENTSDRWTRRLFYNLCSRSSRTVTAWSGVVSEELMEAARSALPAEYRHMIRLDVDLTRELGTVDGSALRRWGLKASSSNALLRDVAYQWTNYGRPADNDNHPGFLLPYTTRLVENTSFQPVKYLSHFKPVPTLKNMAGYMRRKAYAAVGVSRQPRANVMAE
jgi:hypothetical protein